MSLDIEVRSSGPGPRPLVVCVCPAWRYPVPWVIESMMTLAQQRLDGVAVIIRRAG